MNRAACNCLFVLGVSSFLLTGCAVDVREEADGGKAEVDIRSPLGNVSVRTDVDNADTGLPVYPDSRPLRDENETGSADVTVASGLFGVKVVATKFESEDAPDRVLAHYRQQMQAFGTVTECRGDVDFRRGQPRCKERFRSSEIQLVAGTEERHRIVSVKPRRSGSEFAVVYIQTSGRG